MIELILLDYLKSALSVPVCMEKPTNETEFVLIEKTGSGRTNHVNSATFAIQSWSTSLYKACALNEAVKEALLGDGVNHYGIAETAEISKCELNSDYEYSDTSSKDYRYQAVFDFIY